MTPRSLRPAPPAAQGIGESAPSQETDLKRQLPHPELRCPPSLLSPPRRRRNHATVCSHIGNKVRSMPHSTKRASPDVRRIRGSSELRLVRVYVEGTSHSSRLRPPRPVNRIVSGSGCSSCK